MKITKRQLRRIIREAIDVMNWDTGEIKVFADHGSADLPEKAWPDLVKSAVTSSPRRLGF